MNDHPLVFLDIDGVLNRHEFDHEAQSNLIELKNVRIFNRLLNETDARIVISSAWRYIVHRREMNLVGFEWMLRSHGLMYGRLIGITAEDTMMPFYDGKEAKSWPMENERGKQIEKWLRNYSFRDRYVVLDDGGHDRVTGQWTDLGINAAGHPVVWTNPKVGLTNQDADRAIEILGGKKNFDDRSSRNRVLEGLR